MNIQPIYRFYLYDLSLPVSERAEKSLPFVTGLAVARFLGVNPQRIYTSASSKHRLYCKHQKKWYAIREKNTDPRTSTATV